MKKCEHDLIEDECLSCLRGTIEDMEADRSITIQVNTMLSEEIDTLRARVAELESDRDRYRAALEALYEAANTKDRVSLDDLDAAYSALNR